MDLRHIGASYAHSRDNNDRDDGRRSGLLSELTGGKEAPMEQTEDRVPDATSVYSIYRVK